MTEPANRTRRTDWWLLGGVGVAAVLLSLIGFAIASRYQPSDEALPPVTVGENTTSTSSASTTTTVSSLPVPSEQTTTTVDEAEPAAITLSEEVLDFGEEQNSLEVRIEHLQGGPANWELVSESSGLSTDPASGQIASGGTASVTVTIDRSQLGEGEFEGALTLSWADGQETAEVLAVTEDNPIIHNPAASPSTLQVASGSGCSPTRTTVSARVRDTSEIEQVIARWSPDGSVTRETAMNPVGNDIFEGVVGPYEATGSDSVRVIAFDVRGNAGGAVLSVAVVDCG
jgi:hypothetical protein